MRATVGSQPATVTPSLMLTVIGTTWPAVRSPLPPASTLLLYAATDGTVEALVPSLHDALPILTAPARLALLPAASLTVAPLRLSAVTARSLVSSPAPTV